METLAKLALLTDAESSRCLSRVLAGIRETHAEIPVTSPDDLAGILRGLAASTGSKVHVPNQDSGLREGAKAIRIVLSQFLEDAELSRRVDAAIKTDRDTLFEPITTALVLAGIVVVLRTRFKMTYKRAKDGKAEFEVGIERKPDSDATIKRFFGLF
ncbi:MAG TPA: hypothetical protein VK760_06680 [Candidatus Acidoferrales bacterium]|nr:hypothetical protein [Candidatus Acidoferrales bacterium]